MAQTSPDTQTTASGSDVTKAYIRELQHENERLRELVATYDRERRRLTDELSSTRRRLEEALGGEEAP